MTKIRDYDKEKIEIDLNERFPGNNGENDFTTYLLQPDILEILREKFGLKLENPITQDNIGGYILDASFTNKTEMIENQFGKSDHKHRGQISTYSDKINATNIIWFAQEFREDHINEFNNLNELYDGKRRFYLIIPKIFKDNIGELIQFTLVTDNIIYDDNETVTGKHGKAKNPIVGFIYNGTEIKTTVCKAALKLICDDLASKHIDFEEKVKERTYFSEFESTISSHSYKIKGTNIFVKTHFDAVNMEKQIRKILSWFGYSQDILQFQYQN